MSILFADGREIGEAEAHRKIKCPKCDHVQSATKKTCSNCGHDLTDAIKAKFAQEAVDPDGDGDDDSGATDADDFPLAGVGYPCAHCHNPVRGKHKRCAVCGSQGPHLFPPSHMSGGPLSTLVSDKKMALMSAAVREAVAVAFNPARHPRGRGGKFREILGKLHELSPGTSRQFGGHLVTRGFGGEEHVFALQRGADLVHRGSAEEVAGRLAPARATKARTTAGDLMGEKSMLGGIMGTRSQHYDSLRKQGVEHEDAMYAALHAQGLSDEEARGAHLTYGPDLDPDKAVATPAAAEFARAARGQQVTLFDRPQKPPEPDRTSTFRPIPDKDAGLFKRGDKVRHDDGRTGKIASVSRSGKQSYGIEFDDGSYGGAMHDELSYAPEHFEKLQGKLDKAQGSQKPPSSKDLLKSFVGMRFPGISTPHNVPDEWVVENGYGEFVNPAMMGRNYGSSSSRRYHPEEGSRVRLMPNASTVERNDAGLPHHRAGKTGVLVSTGKGTTSGTDVVRFDRDIGATRVLSRDVMGEEDRAYVRLKPGVDTESMQYHYLVGHPPRTKFGPNSAGYAQWMYGMPKKYGGTGPVKAGEKEAVLRRIAGAVEAIQEGDRVTYERLLSEACEIKALTEGPLGAIHVAGVSRFDPARHPRGRGGKWVDVLGKLRTHGYHSLGLGISVEHDGMIGFKVRDGSNRVIRFSDDVTAVKHAVSLHENQRRRAFGPSFVRRAPGGERVELAPPREPGEPLQLHSPHAAGLAAHVLRGMGREFAARDVEANHEIHVENHSDAELEKLASAFRDRGHHTSASFVHRELDARRARDAGSGFERASLAPRVREPGSVSKAQALVDSGLASDMADARAQLADMGELTRRTPGEGGEDLGIYGTEQLHMAAERLRRTGNLTDAQHVQRELNRRYRESSLRAPRPMGMGHVLRSPGGERSPQSDATIGGGGGGMGTDVAGVLMGLGPGAHEITVGGVPFTVYYDEQGATGDNGMPVRGDKTGDWELFRGHGGPVGLGPALARVHVSPHGSSGYGNAGAPRYAAEQVARAIHKEVLRQETRQRRSPGGERLPFGAERARAVIARSDGETPQARVEGHFFDLPMARNRGESFPEGTTGLAHYERIGAGGLWRFVADESQPGPGFREHPTRAEARASMLRARAAYPSADARVSRAVQRLSATMAEHPLSREDALAMGRNTPGGERSKKHPAQTLVDKVNAGRDRLLERIAQSREHGRTGRTMSASRAALDKHERNLSQQFPEVYEAYRQHKYAEGGERGHFEIPDHLYTESAMTKREPPKPKERSPEQQAADARPVLKPGWELNGLRLLDKRERDIRVQKKTAFGTITFAPEYGQTFQRTEIAGHVSSARIRKGVTAEEVRDETGYVAPHLRQAPTPPQSPGGERKKGSYYRLYVDSSKTEHVVQASSPAKALKELATMAGHTIASQNGRYGKNAEGVSISAMTEPWGRRKLDPFEGKTRPGAPRGRGPSGLA